MIPFAELVLETSKRSQGGQQDASLRLLALDPGETTGWAFFEGHELKGVGQVETGDIVQAQQQIELLINNCNPSVVVIEDYRIYSWRSKQHSWSNLHTPRVIGCAETICAQRNLPVYKQIAQVAKKFVTDDKLRAWNFYVKGKKHARDAIRHGCYWILFHKTKLP